MSVAIVAVSLAGCPRRPPRPARSAQWCPEYGCLNTSAPTVPSAAREVQSCAYRRQPGRTLSTDGARDRARLAGGVDVAVQRLMRGVAALAGVCVTGMAVAACGGGGDPLANMSAKQVLTQAENNLKAAPTFGLSGSINESD